MKKTLLQMIFVLFVLTVHAQTVLYVTPDGNGTKDGSDWDNALSGAELQYAINSLESDDSQNMVFVAEGVYFPTQTISGNTHVDSTRYYSYTMKKGVAVFGGFRGVAGETIDSRIKEDIDMNGKIEPWEFKNKTVFSGEFQEDTDSTNNSIHIVQFVDCDSLTSILDGVTVTGGYSDVVEDSTYFDAKYVYASGICVKKGSVQNCHVTNCSATVLPDGTSDNLGVNGVAIMAYSAIVDGCKIDSCNGYVNRNWGYVLGGGVSTMESVLKNTTIDKCHSNTLSGSGSSPISKINGYGGGIYANKSYIDNCIITSCTNIIKHYGGYDYPYGGGAYIRSSRFVNSIVQNCYVESNHDIALGGGVYIGNYSTDNFEDAAMINCVISNNTCQGKSMANGGGVYHIIYGTGWVEMPIMNSTITNNHLRNSYGTSSDLYGSGIDCSKGYWHSQDPSAATLINNLVWGNVIGSSSKTGQVFAHAGSTLNYNAVEGTILSGTGNINLSAANEDVTGPFFKEPATFFGCGDNVTENQDILNADWGIKSGSACANKGIPDTTGLGIPAYAVYGNIRIYDDVIDIGAAEFAIYSVVYNLDGGANSSVNPPSYTIDSADITLHDAVKEGYLFEGWFIDAGFTTQITQIDHGSVGDMEFWAKWKTKTYSVTYNLDEGTNHGSNPSTYTIETPDINLAAPAKTGYTFSGWFSDAGLTESVTSIQQGSTGDIELWAKWEPEVYSITYHLDGSTNHGSNPSTYTIETPDINLAAPVKTGYTFSGWFSDAGLTESVTSILQGSTGDTELWTMWEPEVYSITYHLEGGTNNASNPDSYTIESPDINLVAPTRDGYTFTAWYTDAGNSTEATSIEQGSTGDKEFWAAWESITANTNPLTDQLSVYPNPCSGRLFFRIPHDVQISSVELRTITGRLVSVLELDDVSSIDLTGKTPGLYLLRFTTESQIFVQKLIVQ